MRRERGRAQAARVRRHWRGRARVSAELRARGRTGRGAALPTGPAPPAARAVNRRHKWRAQAARCGTRHSVAFVNCTCEHARDTRTAASWPAAQVSVSLRKMCQKNVCRGSAAGAWPGAARRHVHQRCGMCFIHRRAWRSKPMMQARPGPPAQALPPARTAPTQAPCSHARRAQKWHTQRAQRRCEGRPECARSGGQHVGTKIWAIYAASQATHRDGHAKQSLRRVKRVSITAAAQPGDVRCGP